MQVKLLRLLQEKSFERLGSERTQEVDVRILSASNVDLREKVRQRQFRGDLLYRLRVVPIELPPLRERCNDIPLLVEHVLAQFCAEMDRPLPIVSATALRCLLDYRWPGNVRELMNALQFALVTCGGEVLERRHLPPEVVPRTAVGPRQRPGPKPTLCSTDFDKSMKETGGNKARVKQSPSLTLSTPID